MTGILGSGFGLYGYLPAVVETSNDKVLLPERSRESFQKRPELEKYADVIVWCSTYEELLQNSETIIVAVPPKSQDVIVGDILRCPNIRNLILEKPLAVTPSRSRELLSSLVQSGRQFRIAYTFALTEWADRILHMYGDVPGEIKIRWTFKAHHYNNNLASWKRYHSSGGSVIRFYGIHLIAFLAMMGFRLPMNSSTKGVTADDQSEWNAIFSNNADSTCEVIVDSNSSSSSFKIDVKKMGANNGEPVFARHDPFESNSPTYADVDNRVRVLKLLINSLNATNVGLYAHYLSTIDLWSSVENINIRSENTHA